MGTTADKLNKLKATKEAIRTAINNKGGTLTESNKFSDYATAIDNIQSGGGDNLLQYVIDNREGDGKPSCNYLFYKYGGTNVDILSQCDLSKVANMQNMFDYCLNLTTIPQLDTSSCTNMSYMFRYCNKLTSISQLNTSKVANMQSMFNGCQNLTTIPQLDTSSCTKMSEMFNNCFSLQSIPPLDTSSNNYADHMFYNCQNLQSIPQLDTSKITGMSYMFYQCHKLTTIDLTHINFTTTSNSNNFAYQCLSLTKLIIRNMDTIPPLNSNAFDACVHFYGITNAIYNPDGLKDGRIYVPDDKVEELKTATNWSVFADIIVPLSTLVEE